MTSYSYSSSLPSPVLIPIQSLYNDDENHDPHRSETQGICQQETMSFGGGAQPKEKRNPNSTTTVIPEYAMIEINGELLPPLRIQQQQPPPMNHVDLEIKEKQCPVRLDHELVELGALQFVQGTPILIIGTHELRGVVQELAQPFCVLQKQQKTLSPSPSSSKKSTSTNNDDKGSYCQYHIAGVVRCKILFANYPKTLMR